MDTIRIYSKKAFAIGPGAQRGTPEIENFITVPLSFQDMPAKYQDDLTFKSAVKAGDITVVKNEVIAPAAQPIVEEKKDEVAEYKEQLKKMKKEEVKEEADKYGAEFVEGDKLSQNKKRVLAAFIMAKDNSEEGVEIEPEADSDAE